MIGGSNINLIEKFSLRGYTLVYKNSGKGISVGGASIFRNELNSILWAFEKFELEEIEGQITVNVTKHSKRLKLILKNSDNWDALNEVFVSDVYQFYFDQQLVVIDVGMNVGMAALFFASMDNVTKVYGFEPSPESCSLAGKNFVLNDVGSKIEFVCAALGKGEKTVQIPKSQSGSVGTTVTDFVMEKIYDPNDFQSTVDITVKDAATVITKVITENDGAILLKLDCEGAEYEIIDDLFDKDILGKLSVVIIEWHYKGKGDLFEKLKRSGFSLFMPDQANLAIPVGFIYGINTHLKLDRHVQ